MKEIIPLKKDIVFKTAIGQITDINLEHNYDIKDNLVEGNVLLYGSYKMTEASVIEEDFNYKITFGVSISKNINKDTIKIEIDDFKYEIEKDILKVNIDLELTCEEKEDMSEEKNDLNLDNYIDDYFNSEEEEEKTITNDVKTNIDINNEIQNITNNIVNNEENYYTYKVYIVRSGDTIEEICNKYNITYEELKEYNDLSELNVGDKIIIPSFNE